MNKPTKPTDLIPRSFGGVKNNFSASLQATGYEDGIPAIYGGDNLNYQLDATGKELDYCEKICDFINEIPIGNTISVDSNNKLIYVNSFNFATRKIGEIVWSTIPQNDAGLHLADGSLLSGSGSYSTLVDYFANLYNDNPSAHYFCTETQWQADVAANGVCGKYVYDSVNNTLRIPKLTGILEGTITANELGDTIEAGLPNITGKVDGSSQDTNHEIFGEFARTNQSIEGAFTGIYGQQYATSEASSAQYEQLRGLVFNASNSNSIYGNSTTVQPQTVKVYYYIVIATLTKTDIEVDIDEIATDLNGKADTDLSNVNNTAKILMSGMGMPSSTTIDLSLGASGTTYTAPANGWFYISKQANAANQYLMMGIIGSNGMSIQIHSTSNVAYIQMYLPVRKEDSIVCTYTLGGNTGAFRFIYAQGSESEAN